MFLSYSATGMPKINMLILKVFIILDVLEGIFFCAVMHIFLCKKERSSFLLEALQVFGKVSMYSRIDE